MTILTVIKIFIDADIEIWCTSKNSFLRILLGILVMRSKHHLQNLFWAINPRGTYYSTQTSNVSDRQISYFFVDTSVILGYRLNQYPGIKAFVENPDLKFFYTETVLDELREDKHLGVIPESDPDSKENKFFRYIDSRLKPNHKQSAVNLLQNLWLSQFEGRLKNPRLGYQLNAQQLESIKRDLFIIFESGYACHAPGVLPDDHFITPPLLTNNVQLIKKFVSKPEAQKILEITINLCGMEHLMPIEYLEDAIKRQQLDVKNGVQFAESTVSKLT